MRGENLDKLLPKIRYYFALIDVNVMASFQLRSHDKKAVWAQSAGQERQESAAVNTVSFSL